MKFTPTGFASFFIILSLMTYPSLAFSQAASDSTHLRPIIPDIKPSATHRTGSVMQNITQVSIPCKAGSIRWTTEDADQFIKDPAYECQISTKKTPVTNPQICYIQLKATEGSSTTLNHTDCPVGYADVLRFGTLVKDPSGNDLVYTPRDVIPTISDMSQWYYYTGQKYQCTDNSNYTTGFSVSKSDGSKCCGWGTGAGEPSGSGYTLGALYSISGVLYRITQNYVYKKTCLIAGASQPDSTCSYTPGSYWEYKYWVAGYAQMCVREAGFFPYDPKPSYNLPSSSISYTPTVVICGRQQVLWKSTSPDAPPITQQCVIP